jgi:hypothetical protein
MLVRCTYASRAVEALPGNAIESILTTSRAHNPSNGITGILCYSGSMFIQVLEGGRSEVCSLYNAIVGDRRHTNVQILSFEEIRERKFCNWTMGHVDLSKINPGLLLKYFERPVFDPFACSGQTTLALLDELLASAAISTRLA